MLAVVKFESDRSLKIESEGRKKRVRLAMKSESGRERNEEKSNACA